MSRYGLLKAAFEALALSHVSPLIRRFSRAKGVIFTLHRVLPEAPAAFAPNAILQVTPDFLEATIVKARAAGFEIVDLDEAARRIESPEATAPFVVLTFDDAYRDNLHHALPILRRHQAPFTLYVPTALVDGVGEIWWQALEDIIAAHDVIVVPEAAGPRYANAVTLEQKHAVFDDLYWRYRKLPEAERIAEFRALAERYGVDLNAHCRALIMDWAELKTFADEPLCTIAAHTVQHYELAKLPEDQARSEIELSAKVIEAQFGIMPKHFSYPLGGPLSAGAREFGLVRELGFRTGVTTRPGGLYHAHKDHLQALPRISLNGNFQKKRYLDVFLTAEVFRLMNKGRVVNVG